MKKHKGKTKDKPETDTKSAPKINDCRCGCGRKTGNLFAQGHDAKVYSILRKVAAGEAEESAIPEAVRDDPTLLLEMRTKLRAKIAASVAAQRPPREESARRAEPEKPHKEQGAASAE